MMIEPGTLLQDRYRVTKQIGQGGMGAVYVATDERFRSIVAIKQTFFDDPTLRKAFEREAHLLNRLRHAALPKVSDHFIEGDGQFLVMEFIEGTDLSELVQERVGAFPVDDVLRWADELLDALDYLHTHEPPIVHRDIKPQNLKLTTRGQIVLLDFGLAKGTTALTRASATASVFGYSRNYAPLEQIQGTGTDARSDLYALAATLYHLLTGTAPIDALTRAGAIINNQPDPLRPVHLLNTQVPATVSRVLHRALTQKAALRPATAAEMRTALRQASGTGPLTSRQVPAGLTQGQPATNEATVVESLTHASGGQQSYAAASGDARSLTQQRRAAAGRGDTTEVRAAYGASGAYDFDAADETSVRPAGKSPAVFIGVGVIALLLGFAVVAYMLKQRSVAAPATSEAQSLVQPGSPDATQTDGANATPYTLPSAETAPAAGQAPAARTAGDASTMTTTQTAGSRGGSTPTETSVAPAGSGGDAGVGNSPSSEAAAAGGRPGLVIQSPAATPAPLDVRAAEESRRAQEILRRQAERQAEAQAPAPNYGGGGAGPYPPPPGDRRPPPHRPPPRP
jgi:hypothetical protein